MERKSQNEEILKYLESGKSITPLESLEKFGCFRLGARIFELKQAGHNIEREMVDTPQGKRVASYRLIREQLDVIP